MSFVRVFEIFFSLVVLTWAQEEFEESLWIRQLPSGHVYTRMEFLITKDDDSDFTHTTFFPRALSEILEAHNVEELHFTLTQGHWNLNSWGDPWPWDHAPTGAQVIAWFWTLSGRASEADANWKGLTNRLSGLTCSSLNFLDETTSIEPKFAYRPQGVVFSDKFKGRNHHIRVGALPREFICTENLTPWTKLLPCGVMRGIASLLRSKQVFNTHYHSAKISYVMSDSHVSLKLSLSLVFDPPSVNVQNDNFARKVIGSLAIFPCHPSKKTSIKIFKKEWMDIKPEDFNSLKVKNVVDFYRNENSLNPQSLIFTPMKYMGGYGQEYGKIVVDMVNYLEDKSLSVLYVEVLPWYIRPYLHTMNITLSRHESESLAVPDEHNFHYTPGRDRKALHKLEMVLQIPPSSKITLSFMVEKGHLKWDEYPPDANHGFYLEAAHFEVNVSADKTPSTRHYYSRILLINLSTPDFSMPYNVICLTCTVVALAFGPIHNITTKRLKLKLLENRQQKFKKFLNFFRKKPPTSQPEKSLEDSKNVSSSGSQKVNSSDGES